MDNSRGRTLAERMPGHEQREVPPCVMSNIDDELDPPFEAIEPAECRGPLLFNSPHSGRIYPRAFLLASRLDMAPCAAPRTASSAS